MKNPNDLVPSGVLPDDMFIRECTVKRWRFNRFLYHYVGAKWDWNDKKEWTEKQWQDYAEHKSLKTYVGFVEATPIGYYELQAQDMNTVQIMYFGLEPGFIGKGYGGQLLTNAVRQAWSWKAKRVWVSTCDLDHPAALQNYLKRGFKLYYTKNKTRCSQ